MSELEAMPGIENTTTTMMAIIDYYSAMNFREAEKSLLNFVLMDGN